MMQRKKGPVKGLSAADAARLEELLAQSARSNNPMDRYLATVARNLTPKVAKDMLAIQQAVTARLPGKAAPGTPARRRVHSRSSQVRCDLCAPLRCKRAA